MGEEKVIEKWLKENWFKASIIAILLFAVFGYLHYLNTKNDFAMQVSKEQRVAQESKDKLEHAETRKAACLEIYQVEGKKWNNVTEWNYDVESDKCEISYKDPNKKTTTQCNKEYSDLKAIWKDDPIPSSFFLDHLRCLDGTFIKTF